MMDYQEFLQSKLDVVAPAGFDVAVADLNGTLFDWQRLIVQWALRLGRAAIFAERGLGKTFMQVEWAEQVRRHTAGRVLIVCPLAVAHQTIDEAARLGISVAYVRSQADVLAAGADIVITNYDMLIREAFDLDVFSGVVLDESSKLKTFTSKTKRFLIDAFAATPYRLACTATPSPNDTTELGNHAEFLGVMSSGEMLTRWFIRDSQHANSLRLKGHAVQEFWRWVTSWAVCVNKPSDLGFDDGGYDLPPLNMVYEQVAVDHSRAWELVTKEGQAQMFLDGNRSATEMWAEKRETLPQRVARVAEIVAGLPEDEPVIIWHDTDYERDAIAETIAGVTVVTGSQSPEVKEHLLAAFSHGQARIMATKPRIGGWGLNWQHCANMIFLGVTHRFEEFYQALGRCHRFGQARPVNAFVVYAESEAGVVASLQEKWQLHIDMHKEMVAAMAGSGLAHEAREDLQMSADVVRDEASGANWRMVLGDSVEELAGVADDSVHLSVSSWPFSDQYMYSASLRDMGNCDGDDDFFVQMGFLLPEVFRVTMPGRWAIVHAKDRLVYGTKNNGFPMIEDFTGKCIQAMQGAGFHYQGRIFISTDVVRENGQTYRLSHSKLKKDASTLGVGMPEYLLLFRKPHDPAVVSGTRSNVPVDSLTEDAYSLARWQIDANSHWRSSGNRLLYPWEAEGVYDYQAHVGHLEALDAKNALSRSNMTEPIPSDSPWCWDDIQRTDTLNHKVARAAQDEKHICPLQLDLIERCIVRWSNPGETVLDYFAGIGSVPVRAVELKRRGLGIELKPEYWRWAVRYCGEAERQVGTPTLFDFAAMQMAGD